MTILSSPEKPAREENGNDAQAPPTGIQGMDSGWLQVSYQLRIKK